MPQTTERVDGAELVQRIIDGDDYAEHQLVEAYGRGVYFVLRRESRNQDVVDDLYQDTFRIAIQKIRKGDLRDPSKVGAFLSSTARFVLIDHYRREAKHDGGDLETFDAVAPDPSPLHQVMGEERANLVRAVLGELKAERDRAILFRHFIAQEDKETICKDLDLTTLHFNRVLHRAKQRYKVHLTEALNRMGLSIELP